MPHVILYNYIYIYIYIRLSNFINFIVFYEEILSKPGTDVLAILIKQ